MSRARYRDLVNEGSEACEEGPSRSRYNNKGCRCDGCKKASSDYTRIRRGTPVAPRKTRVEPERRKPDRAFSKEVSGSYVMTLTREEWLKARASNPVHVVQRETAA